MIRNLISSAAILTFASISPLRAQGHACENGQAQVTAADPDLAGHVCTVVDRALDQLAQCHLSQKAPLTINIVDGFKDDRPGSLAGINILIMLLAPDAFAAEVWLHFSAKGNGCNFIGQLLSGEKAIGSVSP